MVFQALLAALFTLSPVERVLLGLCAFLVSLGITLVVAKMMWGRGLQAGTITQANSGVASLDTELREAREAQSELSKQLQRQQVDFQRLIDDRNRLITHRDQQTEKRREAELESDRLRRQLNPPAGGRQIRIPTAEAFDHLKEEVTQIRGERDALKEKIEPIAQQQEQPDREELKRDCRQMADDLRRFLKDNGGRSENEVMELYRDRLLYKVSALLEELEEHSLYPPKNLQSFEIAANSYPRSPMAIERLAKTLGTIGYRR